LSDPAKRRRYDDLYRAHTALQPVTGVGITLNLLGVRVGLAVDAGVSRRAARPPKPPPKEGPPRRPPRGR
jgi:hypothetical protein